MTPWPTWMAKGISPSGFIHCTTGRFTLNEQNSPTVSDAVAVVGKYNHSTSSFWVSDGKLGRICKNQNWAEVGNLWALFEKQMPLKHVQRHFWRCVAESNHCNRFCRPAPDHSANAPLRNANIRHFSESTRPFLKHFRIFEETNDSLR